MSDSLDVARMALRLGLTLAVGGLLAVLIREIYKRWGETPSNRAEFGNLFPLLTLATIVAVTVARQSIALSLGLIGAVSIVRYRAAIKSPEELVYVLFCVSVGLALGADQLILAVTSVPIVGLFIALGHVAFAGDECSPRVPRENRARSVVVPAKAPAAFTLLPNPTGGGLDLARRELKFALSHVDSDKLRTVLEVNCQRIFHRGPSTVVSTIYFDDPFLGACREHLDGAPRRAKVRLRWYDDDLQSFFFEVKRREYAMVRKERLMIRSRVPLTAMSYEDIVAALHQVLPLPASEMLRSRAEAALITQYRREYFRSRGLSTRLTLDERIVSYSQIGLHQPNQRFGMKERELVILEAKVPENGGEELREVLHPLQPYLTKSSKYVRGCLRLGLLTETEAY